jgi:hypothetical protein
MVEVSWKQNIYEIQYWNQSSKDVYAFLSSSLQSKKTDAYSGSFSFFIDILTFQVQNSQWVARFALLKNFKIWVFTNI